MSAQPTRVERLELDIDLRLADLWKLMQGMEWDLESAAIYMRAAYAKGYCDALVEREQDRGSLCRDHGYRIPPKAT